MNKRLLIIAGALSAFALVFLGSVFAKMQERSVAENHPTAQLPAQQFGAPSDGGAQLASAPSALAPVQAANTPSLSNPQNPSTTPPAPSTRMSSAQAQQLAQQAQPSARVQGTPELVRYGGRLAYEVPFVQGKIYVNAENGAILGNSMAQAIQETQAVQPNYQGDEHDDDDEHEYREHHKKREHKKHDQDEEHNNEHEERENV